MHFVFDQTCSIKIKIKIPGFFICVRLWLYCRFKRQLQRFFSVKWCLQSRLLLINACTYEPNTRHLVHDRLFCSSSRLQQDSDSVTITTKNRTIDKTGWGDTKRPAVWTLFTLVPRQSASWTTSLSCFSFSVYKQLPFLKSHPRLCGWMKANAAASFPKCKSMFSSH